MSRLKVSAGPAFKNRKSNPYNSLLYSALEREGVEVSEFRFSRWIPAGVSVVHLHWMDTGLCNFGWIRILDWARLIGALIILATLRVRGIQVIWTAHNVEPHEIKNPVALWLFWLAFPRLISGWISFSDSARRDVVRAYPRLSSVPCAIIPHGHYRDCYGAPEARGQARARLEIPESTRVLLCFGMVREYKNIPTLIQAFRQLKDPKLVLVIAGSCKDKALEAEIHKLSEGDSRIRLFLEFIPDDQIRTFFGAADACILPYSQVLNSGAALLSLSMNRPILVAKQGSLIEVAERLGPDWIVTFEGCFTASVLEDFLGRLSRRQEISVDLSAYDWPKVAALTLDFYRSRCG